MSSFQSKVWVILCPGPFWPRNGSVLSIVNFRLLPPIKTDTKGGFWLLCAIALQSMPMSSSFPDPDARRLSLSSDRLCATAPVGTPSQSMRFNFRTSRSANLSQRFPARFNFSAGANEDGWRRWLLRDGRVLQENRPTVRLLRLDRRGGRHNPPAAGGGQAGARVERERAAIGGCKLRSVAVHRGTRRADFAGPASLFAKP